MANSARPTTTNKATAAGRPSPASDMPVGGISSTCTAAVGLASISADAWATPPVFSVAAARGVALAAAGVLMTGLAAASVAVSGADVSGADVAGADVSGADVAGADVAVDGETGAVLMTAVIEAVAVSVAAAVSAV